jgi:uncharacterized protein YbaR (Trm112 family)
MPGDIICCPRCNKQLFMIQRKLMHGDLIELSDFSPIGAVPSPRSGDPMVCYFCGSSLIYDGHFATVERREGKDLCEDAASHFMESADSISLVDY